MTETVKKDNYQKQPTIQVIARIRPVIEVEQKFPICLREVEPDSTSKKPKIVLSGNAASGICNDRVCSFEKVLNQATTQSDVFE